MNWIPKFLACFQIKIYFTINFLKMIRTPKFFVGNCNHYIFNLYEILNFGTFLMDKVKKLIKMWFSKIIYLFDILYLLQFLYAASCCLFYSSFYYFVTILSDQRTRRIRLESSSLQILKWNWFRSRCENNKNNFVLLQELPSLLISSDKFWLLMNYYFYYQMIKKAMWLMRKSLN